MDCVETAPASAVTSLEDVRRRAPRLDRGAIEEVIRSGKRLLVQGAMGIHASDGLSGKVAAWRGPRLVGVGTISAVVKSEAHLRSEIRRARADAPSGFVGMNLMAAINRQEFDTCLRIAFEEGVSFVVQGAGISRDVVRTCREAGIPFAGIVSSGRLAKMYEKWGAEFLVAEGAEAGGHIGDVGHPLPALLAEVVASTSLPVIAAGGIDADDLPSLFAAGAAGAQLATRFLACADGDAHPNFKQMHLGKRDDDVVLITSTVKGMKARAVRNKFTEALAAGKAFPPRSKAWAYGKEGYHGRRKACVECLATDLCICRATNFQESFCITDALLLAALKGDMENGLFYTGQSVTRLPETDAGKLPTVLEIMELLESRVAAADWAEAPAAAALS
ncbi:NAD(P)H-dependent flavin oxidoreductase [Anaeromyxobacter diazotrophicus]|uniref:2-nitropropane dioxygenase n=1 Tax=Anaeromyxobacter diazotrophicus TaxID=2590199 RepID=A0A7I9VTS7_9BACT|nr:nitronate monooxygenase [Anaeromyxobacter diazotrophicus]GEJ59549.1 2-nitropropane dioxygenase [Anaeromyxobacter diazotrophicus]